MDILGCFVCEKNISVLHCNEILQYNNQLIQDGPVANLPKLKYIFQKYIILKRETWSKGCPRTTKLLTLDQILTAANPNSS